MLQIRGVLAIPPCTFDEADNLVEEDLRSAIRFCLESGAHGIAVPMNASEFHSLTEAERKRVADIAVSTVAGRVPVIIGTSATSGRIAFELSRHARKVGADAVCAMPPFAVKCSPAEIVAYYRQVSEAGLPVMVQNFVAPMGTPMPAALLTRLVNEIDGVHYIKEETEFAGQVTSEVLRQPNDRLRGIIGGKAGRYMLDEFGRGACGTMPACEAVDWHVAVWNALEAGDMALARRRFNALLPLLNFEALYGVQAVKAVLQHRGVIKHTGSRVPGRSALDANDRQELDTILVDLAAGFR